MFPETLWKAFGEHMGEEEEGEDQEKGGGGAGGGGGGGRKEGWRDGRTRPQYSIQNEYPTKEGWEIPWRRTQPLRNDGPE